MSFLRFTASISAGSVAVALALTACASGGEEDEDGVTVTKGRDAGSTPEGGGTTIPEASTPDASEPATDSGVDAGPPPTDAGPKDAAVDAAPADAGSDASDAGACVTTAPSNACGLVAQCGCASDRTCAITTASTGAVSCVVAGTSPVGSPCTATTQCAKGLTCEYGTCRPYCATSGAACASTSGTCTEVYDADGDALPNAKVCTIPCDPTKPAAACGTNTCIFDTGLLVTDCDAHGGAGMYDICDAYNSCKPGLACINHPLFGFECERWCRIGGSDCGLGETCEDVYGADAPMSGGAKLGHCQ